jgi:hypothetical protein
MTSQTALNATKYIDLTASVPTWYSDKIEYDSSITEYWTKEEGVEGSNSAIQRRDGRLTESGSKEYFTGVKENYYSGVTGDDELSGNEAKIDFNDYYMEVDFIRHAFAFSKKASSRSIADLAMVAQPLLTRWLARKKDYNMDYRLIVTESPTTVYAGDATSPETLTSACKFGWNTLQKGYAELQATGVEPVDYTTEKGEQFSIYECCITEYDYENLKNDNMWIKSQAEANVKGLSNGLFTGAVGLTTGMLVKVRRGIRGKPISYLRPEALLYTAHDTVSSTDAALDPNNIYIIVGANDGNNWTAMFPDSGTIAITGLTGVTEFVTYSAKGKYYFTIESRGATYGNITSVPASYAAGCVVTYGAHESRQIFYGSKIAYRCYATPFKTVGQMQDYEHIKGIGISGEMGECSIKNTDDKNKNYIITKCNSMPLTAVSYGA